MLSEKELRRIGRDACIYWFGRDYVEAHRDGVCAAYGYADDDSYQYSIGITPNLEPEPTGRGILYDESPFEYQAFVLIDVNTGDVTFEKEECRHPNGRK